MRKYYKKNSYRNKIADLSKSGCSRAHESVDETSNKTLTNKMPKDNTFPDLRGLASQIRSKKNLENPENQVKQQIILKK